MSISAIAVIVLMLFSGGCMEQGYTSVPNAMFFKAEKDEVFNVRVNVAAEVWSIKTTKLLSTLASTLIIRKENILSITVTDRGVSRQVKPTDCVFTQCQYVVTSEENESESTGPEIRLQD